MVLLEYIMFSQELVPLYYKVMKMRYLKSSSTLKVIRSSRLVVIKLAEYGTLIRERNAKPWMDTKMRYSRAHSTMRVIQ